jgi:hypothetical protein
VRWTIAHQGSWDEILIFGVPVLLALGVVRWANRRAASQRDESDNPPNNR